jgi:hypothetical protein
VVAPWLLRGEPHPAEAATMHPTPGKTACTLRRIAKLRRPTGLLLRGDGAARRTARKTQRRCRQMNTKHADGPEPGMVVHGSDRGTTPWRAALVRKPLPHLRVSRTSACICIESCLLRRAPHAAATNPASCASARTPCTNSGRLFDKTARGKQNPMHQKRLPGWCCPTSRPKCKETMVRLDGIGPADISFDKRP